MKNKSTILGIFFIIFGLMLGMLIPVLVNLDILSKIGDSFLATNIFLDILFCIGLIYSVLIIHEFGHAFIFMINKIEIKSFIVHMFGITKKEKMYTPFVNGKMFLFFGGMVVPTIKHIDESNFQKVKEVFQQSILFGPIFSIIAYDINLVLSVLFIFISHNPYIVVFSLLSLFLHTILFVIILISSSKEKGTVYGDFRAHKRLKDNDILFLNAICQYHGGERTLSDFLYILEKLRTMGHEEFYKDFSAVAFHIYYYLIKYDVKDEFFILFLKYFLRRRPSLNYQYHTYFIMSLYAFLYDYDSYAKIKSIFNKRKEDEFKDFNEAISSLEYLDGVNENIFTKRNFLDKYIVDITSFYKESYINVKSIEKVNI